MFFRISSSVLMAAGIVAASIDAGAVVGGGLEAQTEAAPVANSFRGGFGSGCSDHVSCAVECLEETGSVNGAVTDGETKITITISRTDGQPLNPGSVRVFFEDGFQAPNDGGFGQVGSDDRDQEVTVQVQDGVGVLQFFTPENFNGPANDYKRTLTYSAEYTPAGGGDPLTGTGFEIQQWRPALVLVHGLWSSEAVWDAGMFSPAITFTADYSDSNAHSFSHNRAKAAQGILKACEGIRRQSGIAMRQIDYAGHSMGGILGRYFDAAHPGFINKFFTLNTPHTGSPMANLLVEVRQELNLPARFAANIALNILGFPWHYGAIDDLQKGSAAINAMGATAVPSHALAGTGGSDLLADNQIAGALRQIIDWLIGYGIITFNPVEFLDCPWQGAKHDFIVGLCSQQGGCSASSQFGGISSIHTSVTTAPNYANKIKQLLNTDSSSGDFANFPAASSVGASWERPACFDIYLDLLPDWATTDSSVQPRGSEQPRVQILEPAPGAVFSPLDDLTVTIGPVGDFQMQTGAVNIPDINQSQSWFEPPFTHTFFIPGDYVGELVIHAVGSDGQGPGSQAEAVTVLVTTDAVLQEMWIEGGGDPPIEIMVGFGDNRQIRVSGLFNDEVIRDITNSSTGTTYSSADPSIVQVTEDGMLIPQKVEEDSETTITATNGNHQAIMTAVVLGIPLEEIFDDRFQIR